MIWRMDSIDVSEKLRRVQAWSVCYYAWSELWISLWMITLWYVAKGYYEIKDKWLSITWDQFDEYDNGWREIKR